MARVSVQNHWELETQRRSALTHKLFSSGCRQSHGGGSPQQQERMGRWTATENKLQAQPVTPKPPTILKNKGNPLLLEEGETHIPLEEGQENPLTRILHQRKAKVGSLFGCPDGRGWRRRMSGRLQPRLSRAG